MSNRELYKRSFDKLRPSDNLEKELQEIMKNQEKKPRRLRARKIITLVAAVVVILSMAVAASASGFAQTVKMWINGREVEAQQYECTEDSQHYAYTETGEDGNTVAVDVYTAQDGSGTVQVDSTGGADGEVSVEIDTPLPTE